MDLKQLAQAVQWCLTVSFPLAAVIFVTSSIAARKLSWFAVHLTVYAVYVVVVDQVKCEYLVSWDIKTTLIVGTVASRLVAHYEFVRDALATVDEARRVGLVLFALGLGLFCGALVYYLHPDVYTQGSDLGVIWQAVLIYQIVLAVMTLWIVAHYAIESIFDRFSDAPENSLPVSPAYRWYGGAWSLFVVSFAANAYLPSVAGWYWSFIGQSSIKLVCVGLWLWPAGRALAGRPSPFLITAPQAGRNCESRAGSLQILLTCLALKGRRRARRAAPRKRCFES